MNEEEEEQELLRMYEGESEEESESDALDSEDEDKIMSILQFTPGLEQEKAESKALHGQSYSIEYVADDSDSDRSLPEMTYTNSDDDIGFQHLIAGEHKKKTKRVISLHEGVVEPEPEVEEDDSDLDLETMRMVKEQIRNRKPRLRTRMRALRMCYGCKMPGHDSKDCQTCKTCGLPKHSTYKCSDYSYCLRCKQLGHFASDCTNKRVTDPCRKCGMTFHVTEQCPSILHAYVDEQPAKRDVISYCYNCASKGHYGDECPDLAVDLHNLPSAFSKYNVSKGSRFDIRKIRNSPPLRDSSQSNRNDYSRYNNNRIDNAYKKRYIEDETEDDDIDHFFKGRKTKKPKQKKKAKEDNRHIHFNQRSESPVLNEFFSNKKPQQRSGNSNWKALNQNILPQPSRSGTVSFDVHSRGSRNTHLPKPSSSGYIDLTLDDDYKTRGPKYHGGYRRK